MNLNGDIKIKALNLSQEILEPLHKKAIKYFDDYYNYLYGRTTNYHIKSCDEDFISSNVKFLFSCFGYKNYYRYTSHNNNINLVIINLKKTNTYILNEINIIKNNFVEKFNIYLNNYVSICQKLYNNLYLYFENKIKTTTMKTFTKNYINNFNEFTINFGSNDPHLDTIFIKKNASINNINNYVNLLKDNINLLNERYYNLYYLPNYDKFLEFPEEIIFKINQYMDELSNNLEFIKNLVNFIYQKRLYNIQNSTIAYINNFLKIHLNYIKANINSSYIIEEYYLPIYNELNITFSSCIEKLKILFKDKTNNSVDNILFLTYDNYDGKIIEILNSANNFTAYLKKIINETFFIINCEDYLTENQLVEENNNSLNNFTLEELCPKEKKKFDEAYSKYNYNVVKLRTSIFYTKSLVEVIYSLFDNLDLRNIINIDKINNYDELLNDKNIINIYNESNYNLLRMSKESLTLLDELFHNFIEDFQSKYTYKNDYLPFIEKLKEIITFKNQDYNNNITYKNKDIINHIYELLKEFNKTLFNQLEIKKNYDYFNLNKTYFILMFNNYKSSLKNVFIDYNNTIKALNNNYIFHNSIKKLLRKYQRNKREYFKELINEFEKKFDFKLLNINYDLGEQLKLYMEKEYNDYEFKYIYQYVELFENYTPTYINKIINDISDIEKICEQNITDIYYKFYSKFEINKTNYIDINYIEELKENYSKCLNYTNGYFNNETEPEKYNNISEIINEIYFNCLKSDMDKNQLDLNQKIIFILNKRNQCFYDLYENINISYINETIELFNCYQNNFYNYSAIYFNNFNETFKNELDNILTNISIRVKDNYIDEYFLDEFIQTFRLEYKNIEINDLYYCFVDIENMISYANFLKYEEYKNILYNLLITSFNSSYNYFTKNILINELIDDINVYINNKFELYFEYITIKIQDEYNYYLSILNTTNSLGYTSKRAFINLYSDIKEKINETLFYLINDDIYFYLDIFYNENKKIFRNNFINYFYYNSNIYNISIFKLKEFVEEIILDRNFNKTLDEISFELIHGIIIKSLKSTIQNSFELKLNKLYNFLESYKINIEKVLEKIKTENLPEDMNNLYELIINYTEVVNNQNNRFVFKVSEIPFNLSYDFINDDLKPPLILIKELYNSIEEKLLNELIEIIKSFPDNYLLIKDKLQLESIYDNTSLFYDYVNETLLNYDNILQKELQSYINKLIQFTFIKGLDYYKGECNNFDCYNDSEIINNTNFRRLEIKENNYKFDFIKHRVNRTNISKFRKLEEYNSKMGAISENDINDFLLEMEYILYSFNDSYLGKDYKNINRAFNLFYYNMKDNYLFKLKRSIEMAAFKFSTILTEESYNKLKDNMYIQYNKIDSYVNNNLELINISKNNFLNLLNYSSSFIELIYNLSYQRVDGYYKTFSELIQNKMKYISENELKSYNNRKLSEENKEEDEDFRKELKEYPDIPKWTDDKNKDNKDNKNNNENNDNKDNKENKDNKDNKNNNENNDNKEIEKFRNEKENSNKGIKSFETFWELTKKFFMLEWDKENIIKNDDENGDKNMLGLFKKEFEPSQSITINMEEINLSLDFCLKIKVNFNEDTFKFPLKIFPYFEIAFAIIPAIESGVCISLGFDADKYLKKEDYSLSLFLDVYGKFEVSLSFDLGFYCPSSKNPIRMSLNLGIKGIIFSGKAGIKLTFYLNPEKYSIDFYYEYKSFQFNFYVLLKITIKIKIINFDINVDIFNYLIFGLKFEYHKILNYNYESSFINGEEKNTKKPWQVNKLLSKYKV